MVTTNLDLTYLMIWSLALANILVPGSVLHLHHKFHESRSFPTIFSRQ